MNLKKHIPNILTMLNLLCGCIAITNAISYELVNSAYCVMICAILDYLDGVSAKLLNSFSELGKQLDSLADMVSFGIVPSIIMFQLIRYPQGSDYTVGEYTSMLAICHFLSFTAFTIAICSAIRLGKFNINNNQSMSFIGLPTPANALLLSSLPVFTENNTFGINNFILSPYFLMPTTILFSYLLLSNINLFNLKFVNFQWNENKIRYIFLALSAILVVFFKFSALPLIIILYILLSLTNNLIKT